MITFLVDYGTTFSYNNHMNKYIITTAGMDAPSRPRTIKAESDKEAAMVAYEVPETEKECKKQFDLTRDQTLAYKMQEDFAGDVTIYNITTKTNVDTEQFVVEIPEN